MKEELIIRPYRDGVDVIQQYVPIPVDLLERDCFKNLSIAAKCMYAVMRKRLSWSSGREWFDEDGRKFIYYSQDSAMALLNCGKDKVQACMKELEAIGLIQRESSGTGKVPKIYVNTYEVRVQEAEKPPCYQLSTVDNLASNQLSTAGKPPCKQLSTAENPPCHSGKTDMSQRKIRRIYNKKDIENVLQLIDYKKISSLF